MKYLKYWLIFILIGCGGDSIISPPVETVDDPKFEIKEWCTIASRNRASTHPKWSGLSGLQQAHSVLNTDTVDLKIEYTLNLYGARAHSDLQNLIPLEEAPFLFSTQGLISKDITVNCDPVNIIENSTARSGEEVFGICFSPLDWDGKWFSVWSTVTIKASKVGSEVTVKIIEESRLIRFQTHKNY